MASKVKDKRFLIALLLFTFFLNGANFSTISAGSEEVKKSSGKEETKEKAAKKKKGSEKVEGKTDSSSSKGDVEKIHSEAVSLYKEGKYEDALKRFEEVYSMDPNPVTLFNIGRCYEKLGKFREAYDSYKKYLESGDKNKLTDAKEAISKIEEMPVKLKIKVNPSDSEVFFDGKPVEGKDSVKIVETTGGQHTILARKNGYESQEKEILLAFGEDSELEVKLEEKEELQVSKVSGEEGKGKKIRSKVPLSIHGSVGATVSTSTTIASYIDAVIGLHYRIKDFSAGISIDNMFFSDSYILAVYPSGSYTLKLPKRFSINFSIGFGVAYLYSSERALDEDGSVLVESGHMWDLVVHADAKVRYDVGPLMVQLIPLHADIMVGAGSIEPAPLAQFAFLAGVAYDF